MSGLLFILVLFSPEPGPCHQELGRQFQVEMWASLNSFYPLRFLLYVGGILTNTSHTGHL